MNSTPEITNTEEIFELIEIILKEQYSKDISDIGIDILFNGASTIPEMESRLKLSFESIKNALIVLLQNKLAASVEVTRKETLIIGYELIVDNILAILQYPKMLYLVNQKFGESAVMIFEEFMNFGILSAGQMFEQVKSRIDNKKGVSNVAVNKMRLMFITLIENNYIVQAAKVKGNERRLKENIDKKKNNKGGRNTKEKKNNHNSNSNKTNNNKSTSTRIKDLDEEIKNELQALSSSAKKPKKVKSTTIAETTPIKEPANDENILIVSI